MHLANLGIHFDSDYSRTGAIASLDSELDCDSKLVSMRQQSDVMRRFAIGPVAERGYSLVMGKGTRDDDYRHGPCIFFLL
jgi:hypothetical protein